MGNREDLLAGAKRCLLDKGYERSTVRDIATEAGVSMAAIGYHFGSRENLLNAALFEAMDEWGAEVARTLGAEGGSDAGTAERFEAMWTRMIDSFTSHRPLWLASVEAFMQAARSSELRDRLADGMRQGRAGQAAALLVTAEGSLPDDQVRSLGSVHMALLSGVMLQWMVSPEDAPSAAEVARGLRALSGVVWPDAEN
ncbi:transcriptional regulator, TetR family [Saccharopolyspora kobensis]|uniref:Transcriptional regulator, TetR family n=1 Tax=Saccharopolyspora kobensis TaxID=146035 RepID=A0A1H6E7A9_9PSEU|nr:TetR/AcrR family transcriptional regulator [Saccharopolyspora kobensis]SEG92834.1 transcriptional regulator, TetR family [Saccharopolyspora kobensis]SFD40607.1 transcriptional regulator, TetR family [Saccharopolyspora kobensis]